jgi:hypothetical protein
VSPLCCAPRAQRPPVSLAGAQGNLKWCATDNQSSSLFDELELPADIHKQLEHLYQQQRFALWSSITTDIVQQGQLHQLRILPVCFDVLGQDQLPEE